VEKAEGKIFHLITMEWWEKYLSGEAPGPINLDLKKTFISINNTIISESDIGRNLQVCADGCRDKTFKVVPHEAWTILSTKYGIASSNDVVRLSIPDLEINYRYFRIKTIPNIQYNKGIRYEAKKIYIS